MIDLQVFKHDNQPPILSKIERSESGACQYAAYLWSGHRWNQRTHIHCASPAEAHDVALAAHQCYAEKGYTPITEAELTTCQLDAGPLALEA